MRVLLIIDPQRDFCLGGALAVTGSEEVISVVNELVESAIFPIKIASKDWHPAGHMSFALWGTHCQQGASGAEFHALLKTDQIDHVVLKGCDSEVDSYSAFFDNAANKPTALPDLLSRIQLECGQPLELFVCGLALDYCVAWSALDARKLGYETTLIYDATRAVNLEPDDGLTALATMRAAGVQMIDSRTLIKSIRVGSEHPAVRAGVNLPAADTSARTPGTGIGR